MATTTRVRDSRQDDVLRYAVREGPPRLRTLRTDRSLESPRTSRLYRVDGGLVQIGDRYEYSSDEDRDGAERLTIRAIDEPLTDGSDDENDAAYLTDTELEATDENSHPILSTADSWINTLLAVGMRVGRTGRFGARDFLAINAEMPHYRRGARVMLELFAELPTERLRNVRFVTVALCDILRRMHVEYTEVGFAQGRWAILGDEVRLPYEFERVSEYRARVVREETADLSSKRFVVIARGSPSGSNRNRRSIVETLKSETFP